MYSKDNEESIFSNLYDKYFIYSENDTIPYAELKTIYIKEIKDVKGIRSFLSYLKDRGHDKKNNIMFNMLIKNSEISKEENMDEQEVHMEEDKPRYKRNARDEDIDCDTVEEELKQLMKESNDLKRKEEEINKKIKLIKNKKSKTKTSDIIISFVKNNDYITRVENTLIFDRNIKYVSNIEDAENIDAIICNSCSDIMTIDFSFRPFINLIEIDCSYSCISEIDDNLIHLKRLVCNNTIIAEIPATLTKLTNITCSSTFITEIPELPNLTYLVCDNSLINNIDADCKSIKILNCSHTNLDYLDSSFENIEELNCSYTKITSIPSSYTKLKILNCSNTNMENLPDTLINIKELNCSYVPNYLDNNLTFEKIYRSISYISTNYTNLKILVCKFTRIKESDIPEHIKKNMDTLII